SESSAAAPVPSYAFFFFRAEDGIRAFHVTGVQTCALPISAGSAAPPGSAAGGGGAAEPAGRAWTFQRVSVPVGRGADGGLRPDRSEERRVGTECRVRWRRWPSKNAATSKRERPERTRRSSA